MRVTLFHPDFHTMGGAERLAVMHAGYLARQGVDISIVTMGHDPALWHNGMESLRVEVFQPRRWFDGLLGPFRQAKLGCLLRRAERALAGFETVVAHSHPCSALLGAARIPGRKLWYCHEPNRGLHLRQANPRLAAHVLGGGALETFASQWFLAEFQAHDEKLRRSSSLRARRAFDLDSIPAIEAIAVNSEFTRDNLQAIYGRTPPRVIYPIVRFDAVGRSRQGLDRSGLKVLVHSRLEVLKNVDTVLRGFARFLAACPGARMHVVGDGSARARLEGLAREVLPGGVCRFHGHLSEAELQQVYGACDVMVLLPMDESFGMVFPEAAVQGLLLVGPDHGGPMEILDGGGLGWPVDAFSPEALADVLRSIWSLKDSDVDRRREAADRACRARFSLDAIGPRLRDFVLQGRPD